MSTPSPLQFLAVWGLIFLTCIAFWAAVVIALPELGLVLLAAMILQLVGTPEAESRDPKRPRAFPGSRH
jgi:hypothetical protein